MKVHTDAIKYLDQATRKEGKEKNILHHAPKTILSYSLHLLGHMVLGAWYFRTYLVVVVDGFVVAQLPLSDLWCIFEGMCLHLHVDWLSSKTYPLQNFAVLPVHSWMLKKILLQNEVDLYVLVLLDFCWRLQMVTGIFEVGHCCPGSSRFLK